MLFNKPFYIIEYIGAFEIRRNPVKFSTEKRNFSVLSYRTSGNTEFCDCEGKITAKSNDVVFIPPNIEYSQSSDESESLIAIHFNGNYPIFKRITVINAFNSPEIGRYFSLILRATLPTHDKPQFDAVSLLYKLISCLDRETTNGAQSEYPKILSDAVEIFKNEYMLCTTYTSSVAARIGVSESYLRRIFSVYIGMPPSEYLCKLRIGQAKKLLQSGYYSISQVSDMCGYSQPKTFTVAFHKAVGLSPSEYAKRN